ncbi:trypsin delta-like [Drosophila obscura]|uniref:trypsin delta-like n=1 Tax=Drosophila obscura TaxID=7282 RepID=UPI001BB1B65C|nr:trypsin delta-like [Drosophila obscura]
MLIQVSFLLAAATLLCAGRVPRTEKRIIGGEDTPIENEPWVVALLVNGKHICGGSIYTKDFIITAAHCVNTINREELQVRAGSSNQNHGGTVHNVAAIKYHTGSPGFSLVKNDIAVLRLSEPLIFNDRVQSIPLAEEEPEARSVARSTGWGCKDSEILFPEILQSVETPILSKEKCQTYRQMVGLREDIICAGACRKSVCSGDSGGPLTLDNKLVGVTVFGIKNRVGFYSNVVYFKDWIQDAIESLS